MPGKPDGHQDITRALRGCYFPGSKEYRAWDEGWRYRYGGTAAANPKTDNPFDSTKQPSQYAAWDFGWDAANTNATGLRRMPATTGVAPA